MPAHPLVIIGAGPSGLAAAAAANRHGVRPVVLDRGDAAGGAFRRMPDALRLISPRWENAIAGRALPEGPPLTTRAEELAYLESIAATLDADFRPRTDVTRVTVTAGTFALACSDGTVVEAQRLLVATGIFDRPVPLSVPGVESVHEIVHASRYRNAAPFAGRGVLVVGGGNSGVWIARELALAGCRVAIAVTEPLPDSPVPIAGTLSKLTGPVLQRIPSRWLPALKHRISVPSFVDADFLASVRRGAIALRPRLDAFEHGTARFADGSTFIPDMVMVGIGYRPALEGPLRGLVTLDSHGHPPNVDGLSTEHAGLAFLGLPHMRTFVSEFLRGIARDAPAVVDRLLRP